MDGTITKGVILSIEGSTAKVAPMKDTRLVSPNIQIADNIDAATLKKGAAVAFKLQPVPFCNFLADL